MTTYQLKDQTTGFFDPETGLKIVRDQTAAPARIGVATAIAIRAGRLIAVDTKPRRASKAEPNEPAKPRGQE